MGAADEGAHVVEHRPGISLEAIGKVLVGERLIEREPCRTSRERFAQPGPP